MRWAMAYPCIAPGCSTRRINMPKVPGNISFLAIEFQGLDSLCLGKTCQLEKGEQEKCSELEVHRLAQLHHFQRALRPVVDPAYNHVASRGAVHVPQEIPALVLKLNPRWPILARRHFPHRFPIRKRRSNPGDNEAQGSRQRSKQQNHPHFVHRRVCHGQPSERASVKASGLSSFTAGQVHLCSGRCCCTRTDLRTRRRTCPCACRRTYKLICRGFLPAQRQHILPGLLAPILLGITNKLFWNAAPASHSLAQALGSVARLNLVLHHSREPPVFPHQAGPRFKQTCQTHRLAAAWRDATFAQRLNPASKARHHISWAYSLHGCEFRMCGSAAKSRHTLSNCVQEFRSVQARPASPCPQPGGLQRLPPRSERHPYRLHPHPCDALHIVERRHSPKFFFALLDCR